MAIIDKLPIYCVGLNHRTAPVELLERVSGSRDELITRTQNTLRDMLPGCRLETVALSTCNRFEIYWAYTPAPGESPQPSNLDQVQAIATLLAGSLAGSNETTDSLYRYSGHAAWEHLFRVSSGLDSAVLGEYEIQGQVTAAFTAAREAKTVGPVLSELFESAIRCGKRARAQTAVGKNAASVSSVAVQLAGSVVGDLSCSCAVVIGAGQTGGLTLKALSRRGLREVHMVNRTLENAVRVAAQWGGCAHSFDSLAELTPRADIIITAATTPYPLITRQMIEPAMEGRGNRPLVIIDIAVPRNVAPDVTDVPGVHLFDVDAIKNTVAENAREREQEIPRVERIISEEIDATIGRIGELLVRPVLAGLWQRAEDIRGDVLDNARKEMTGMPDDQWLQVERMARSLMKRLLHTPARRLRDEAGGEDAAGHAAAIEYLFDLDYAEKSASPHLSAREST